MNKINISSGEDYSDYTNQLQSVNDLTRNSEVQTKGNSSTVTGSNNTHSSSSAGEEYITGSIVFIG